MEPTALQFGSFSIYRRISLLGKILYNYTMDTVINSLSKIKGIVSEHKPKPIGKYRKYSVIIPLIERNGNIELLFEIRSDNLRKQPGEIAFPGGKLEPNETPARCAVRETSEELGIPENCITVFGPLNYVITYSNFTMYAFAGTISDEGLENAEPNPMEVKEVFYVPLKFFMETEPQIYTNILKPEIHDDFPTHKLNNIAGEEGYKWRTGRSDVPMYTWIGPNDKEYVIWGLTARVIQDFVGILKEEK